MHVDSSDPCVFRRLNNMVCRSLTLTEGGGGGGGRGSQAPQDPPTYALRIQQAELSNVKTFFSDQSWNLFL